MGMYLFYGRYIVKWVTTSAGRLALTSREQKASRKVNEQFAQENDPQNAQAGSIDLLEQPSQERREQEARTEEKQQMTGTLGERAAGARSLRLTRNVLSHARARLAVEPKVWDSNPWLLGTKRGVIDLRTGTMRGGRPDDHIRTIIPTEWKGLEEPAPRFEQFLQEIFADREDGERAELIAFLQRALGYGITGLANEHIFLMLYGEEGHNGKHTLMHALSHVLGKAVGALPPEMLIAGGPCSTPGSAKPHLRNLQGKRIAWASEPSKGTRFSTEQIRMLTSDEPIVTPRFYAREITFRPSHLLILLGNHKPEAEAADRTFWERICPIVLNMRFVAEPVQANERLRNTHLAHDLESEASGILAWLVRGSLEWQRAGLAIPPCIFQARKQCRGKESVVANFVRTRCSLDPNAQTPASSLYKAYRAWASDNGLIPIGNHQFVREMRQLEGVNWQRSKKGKFYQGIALQE
jgi:P4 family phage/plasmid primase-like protien